MTTYVPESSRCPHIDEEFQQQLHEQYVELRAEGPVHPIRTNSGLRAWLVTRYADAKAALLDPALSKDYRQAQEIINAHAPEETGDFEPIETVQAQMLNMDPPDHTRLRKLVVKVFTSRRVEALRPRVEEIAAELLDEMSRHDTVDLLDHYAFPLPIRVISELLGIPDEHRDEFRRLSNTIFDSTRREDNNAAARALSDLLIGIVEGKRACPGDDLTSALIEVSEDTDQLSQNELISMIFLLLVAGHETTVNLIGNAGLQLLRDPELFARLRADPDCAADVVEEALRHEGPVHLTTLRHTVTEAEIGGVVVPAGELVLISLSSANRDPEKFTEPDTFDPERSTSGHLAFGHGIHFCAGAPLARLEAQIALRALVERFPRLSLAVEPEKLRWRGSSIMRGLHELPVRMTS